MLTVELLRRSVTEWNEARQANPEVKPTLSYANLSHRDLSGTNLSEANLWGANLSRTNLSEAYLSGANLSMATLFEADLRGVNLSEASLWDANLRGANLRKANLIGAKLSEANLRWANLSNADLRGSCLSNANLRGENLREADLSTANFYKADLIGANLTEANLTEANLSRAILHGANLRKANLFCANLSEALFYEINLSEASAGYTVFADIDFSRVKGLDTIKHEGPSTIGIDTLYKSRGNIPEVFLKGCGVPDILIEYVHSLTSKAIEFYSCFISHSTVDKAFADRLYADLQANGVRCWYAPHDLEGGKYLHVQIGEAIRQHEKLLLILTENSINSDWVKQEITKAKKREYREGKQVLFPIGLIEYSKIEEWEFPDSKGRDLAEEIRLYYIPSFVGWDKDNEAYTTEFEKLLNSFHAERNTEGKV